MRMLTRTLLAGLSLACDRDPPTLTGAGSGPESGFDRAGRPDLLNPRVVQFEDVVGLLVIDPATSLFSVHVATDEAPCKTTPTLYAPVRGAKHPLVSGPTGPRQDDGGPTGPFWSLQGGRFLSFMQCFGTSSATATLSGLGKCLEIAETQHFGAFAGT